MYQLLVFYPEKKTPHAVINIPKGPDVLEIIPKILAEHVGCEHVVVMSGATRLFAVDCAGNRLP